MMTGLLSASSRWRASLAASCWVAAPAFGDLGDRAFKPLAAIGKGLQHAVGGDPADRAVPVADRVLDVGDIAPRKLAVDALHHRGQRRFRNQRGVDQTLVGEGAGRITRDLFDRRAHVQHRPAGLIQAAEQDGGVVVRHLPVAQLAVGQRQLRQPGFGDIGECGVIARRAVWQGQAAGAGVDPAQAAVAVSQAVAQLDVATCGLLLRDLAHQPRDVVFGDQAADEQPLPGELDRRMAGEFLDGLADVEHRPARLLAAAQQHCRVVLRELAVARLALGQGQFRELLRGDVGERAVVARAAVRQLDRPRMALQPADAAVRVADAVADLDVLAPGLLVSDGLQELRHIVFEHQLAQQGLFDEPLRGMAGDPLHRLADVHHRPARQGPAAQQGSGVVVRELAVARLALGQGFENPLALGDVGDRALVALAAVGQGHQLGIAFEPADAAVGMADSGLHHHPAGICRLAIDLGRGLRDGFRDQHVAPQPPAFGEGGGRVAGDGLHRPAHVDHRPAGAVVAAEDQRRIVVGQLPVARLALGEGLLLFRALGLDALAPGQQRPHRRHRVGLAGFGVSDQEGPPQHRHHRAGEEVAALDLDVEMAVAQEARQPLARSLGQRLGKDVIQQLGLKHRLHRGQAKGGAAGWIDVSHLAVEPGQRHEILGALGDQLEVFELPLAGLEPLFAPPQGLAGADALVDVGEHHHRAEGPALGILERPGIGLDHGACRAPRVTDQHLLGGDGFTLQGPGERHFRQVQHPAIRGMNAVRPGPVTGIGGDFGGGEAAQLLGLAVVDQNAALQVGDEDGAGQALDDGFEHEAALLGALVQGFHLGKLLSQRRLARRRGRGMRAGKQRGLVEQVVHWGVQWMAGCGLAPVCARPGDSVHRRRC